jgi:xanthine dehydrogenase iron-sulfur cluster and FAD-binding subunit A
MAISKVALAATALLEDGVVREIRLAAASLAPYPARFYLTEDALLDQQIDANRIQFARNVFLEEAKPIDDIRSTGEYRKQVGANLLEEFLIELQSDGSPN